MENATLDMVYKEITIVRRELEELREIIIKEEELSESELKELDKLREEARSEYKKRQTVKLSDL